MSINCWRYVEYTDDGCALYQCLACYEQWEARTQPGWFTVEGEYRPAFRFCPFCGTQWETPTFTGSCSEPQYGPRRTKIKEAVERRERADRERQRYDAASQFEAYPGCWDPPFHWLIQERTYWFHQPADKEWRTVYKMPGLVVSARSALECAAGVKRVQENNHVQDEDESDNWRLVFETRVIVVRKDARRKYLDWPRIYTVTR